MRPGRSALHILVVAGMVIVSLVLQARGDAPGCRTGGAALAEAYVRSNPLYALFLGELEPYVTREATHFRAGGDSIQCAAALSQAFLGSAVRLYDPNDLRRKQELDAQLGSIGISPGPQQPTLSTVLYAMGMRLSRLARVLPAAADGDYGPFYTPATSLEEMELSAGQILRTLLRDPSMAAVLARAEPLIRQQAEVEQQIISEAARQAAGNAAKGNE